MKISAALMHLPVIRQLILKNGCVRSIIWPETAVKVLFNVLFVGVPLPMLLFVCGRLSIIVG